MISSQSVPLLAILASFLTLTCPLLIKSTLYPNRVIFISETSIEFVIFFLFLQPQHLQIHLSPANLTTAIHFTLASHKQISTNFNAFKTHWHVSLQALQNINTSHQHSKTYIGFILNKESITKSVFSHTKQSQINNLHVSTIVFHFRHILFLHDLLIHLFFPFHMSDHHLAKGLSLSSVHDSGTHFLLIPETRPLYQYSVPGSKHPFSKLRSLPRLFPISLGAVHKVCHAVFDDFSPPPPPPVTNSHKSWTPPLKVCHTSEQKVNKQISRRMETALNNYLYYYILNNNKRPYCVFRINPEIPLKVQFLTTPKVIVAA